MEIDPKKIISSTKIKFFKFSLPLNSARNLLPALPKKFDIKIVIIKQKFIVTLISPSIFAPNVLPTRKLNVKGIKPMKINASPVYSEFFTNRRFNKDCKKLKFSFIKIDSKRHREN